MNQQRNLIYQQRTEVLEGRDLHNDYIKMIQDRLSETVFDFCAEAPNSADWDVDGLSSRIRDLFGDLDGLSILKNASDSRLKVEDVTETLTREALERFENREEELGSAELMREAERIILLRTVDSNWMEHIDAMDDLRDSIGMRGYAQHDPVIEYKREGMLMFEAMTRSIQEDAVRLIMRAKLSVEQPLKRKPAPSNLTASHRESESAFAAAQAPRAAAAAGVGGSAPTPAPQQPVRRQHLPGRNDPCWCGSGKKYKNCHLRSDESKS